MQIELHHNYLSLTPFNENISTFTVITGVNGAGKTHLLKGVSNGSIILRDGNNHLNYDSTNNCRYIASSTLAPQDSTVVYPQSLMNPIDEVFRSYERIKEHLGVQKIEAVLQNSKERRTVVQVAELAGKPLNSLTKADFLEYYPINADFGEVFHNSLSLAFKRYHQRRDDNRYRQYLVDSRHTTNLNPLSEEDFIKKFGPAPWDLINDILSRSKVDYKVAEPDLLKKDLPYELLLTNVLSGATIKFSELSSGEKVLMSIVLALYSANIDISFPKVLLLDEPDSALHPSMCKQLLDVLQQTFVNKNGVTVLITTHSPTTVALSPEESLFLMSKRGTRIAKATKDTALQLLLDGIPAVSVKYENRRQIFVESKNDVSFYESIYMLLKEHLQREISLSFISSGVSASNSGNSDQVIRFVNQLSTNGTTTIFGVVDWDNKNRSQGFIKVMGEGKRYSIENFVLDPLIIGLLLMRNKEPAFVKSVSDLKQPYSDAKIFIEQQLQTIVDAVVSTLSSKISFGSTISRVKYMNGKELSVPDDYLKYRGHDLEHKVKECFPHFGRYQQEGDLKRTLINQVLDDFPEFIPIEFLELFSSIQHHS